MNYKKTILISFLIIAVISLFIFSDNSDNNSSDNNSENYLEQIDKKIKVKNYEGESIKLSSFKGKPLIINSWAVWCPFCVEELKDFAKAKNQLDKDFEVIAINRAEEKEKTENFITDLGIKNDLVFLLDPNDSFYTAIGGFSMPETVFVNENGKIIFHKRGPMDLVEIKQKISEKFNKGSINNN